MRLLLPLLLLVPTMLHAEQLPLERLFQDPALTGPRPLKLAVAPDGARVTFLRGKAAYGGTPAVENIRASMTNASSGSRLCRPLK